MNKKNPKGAGRPLKYGMPIVERNFRLPSEHAEHIVKLFNRYLTKFIKK